MRKSTRMLLMNSGRTGQRDHGRESRDYNYDRQGGGMDYEPQDRFRDQRGRERYNDSRYAPMSTYNDGRGDMVHPYTPYVPPVYEHDDAYRQDRSRNSDPMNRIGFAVQGEMKRMPQESKEEYPYGFERRQSDEAEPEYYRKEKSIPFTKEIAMEWTGDMENSDGSKGPHWSMEQVRQVMEQRGIDCDPLQFFAVLNAVYSDYYAVAKKHGVNKMDFYADIAKAWLNDSDAVGDKAARYFEYIVKH